jgi:hypothetical protein
LLSPEYDFLPSFLDSSADPDTSDNESHPGSVHYAESEEEAQPESSEEDQADESEEERVVIIPQKKGRKN